MERNEESVIEKEERINEEKNNKGKLWNYGRKEEDPSKILIEYLDFTAKIIFMCYFLLLTNKIHHFNTFSPKFIYFEVKTWGKLMWDFQICLRSTHPMWLTKKRRTKCSQGKSKYFHLHPRHIQHSLLPREALHVVADIFL